MSEFFSGKYTVADNGCWEWQRALNEHGYGVTRCVIPGVPKVTWLAHRLSLFLDGRLAWDSSLHVCHSCDNPPCIRPDHLWVGDDAANHGDMVRKGRSAKGERHSQAKLTPEDVLIIRALFEQGLFHREIAALFDVRAETVGKIIRRERWAHV